MTKIILQGKINIKGTCTNFLPHNLWCFTEHSSGRKATPLTQPITRAVGNTAHLFTPSSSLSADIPPSRRRSCLPISLLQDYGNNGGLCTARASEETTPTHESPPPAGPSNHQTPAVSNRTPPTRSSRPFYPPRSRHNHPFIHFFHNKTTVNPYYLWRGLH